MGMLLLRMNEDCGGRLSGGLRNGRNYDMGKSFENETSCIIREIVFMVSPFDVNQFIEFNDDTVRYGYNSYGRYYQHLYENTTVMTKKLTDI